MTIKEWYPNYNIIKRLIVWLKYHFNPQNRNISLACFLYYKFDLLSKEKRKDILLDDEIAEYEKRFNANEYREIFNDKKKFYLHFNKYMRRGITFLEDISFDEFTDFIKRYGKIVLKPAKSYGGTGLKLVNERDCENINALSSLFDICKKNKYIAEEYLINEESYREIYSGSLNTVRVNTLLGRNGRPVIYAVINQFGSRGSITDNDEHLGIWAAVNLENGQVYEVEKDDETGSQYLKHPDSNKDILGFQNKEFDKVKKLALEAAEICPECRLIGWDIAVTTKGVELIEGNVTPELGIYQAMTGEGLRTLFENEIL